MKRFAQVTNYIENIHIQKYKIIPIIIIALSKLLYVIDVVIDVSEPSSFHGCRGPNEIFGKKSCKSCCVQDGKDCFKKAGDDGVNWYNVHHDLLDQTCPDNCPKCASCLLRDEDQLMSLKPPEQCEPEDCKTMETGLDPCYGRDSCECFCSEANHLMEKCPDVKPDWLPG